MLNNINMEFIQAFNPLYAVPIVAVILCAFIVYAFGFKSPVQPPSFEGIEEEKKYSKKRRGKETQKSNKLIQNGRVNGSTVSKGNAVATKKKESSEKLSASEKSSSATEKTPVVEKKATKKTRVQNEKKLPQEKKKESFSHDELNDDGWVQLISKKGRKNRKKDDVVATETQSNAAVLNKATEANKSDDSSPVEESPKRKAEFQSTDLSKDQKQPPTPAPAEEKAVKDVKQAPNVEKPKMQNVIVEVAKPDNVEKQHSKEIATKGTKVLEESSKPKKKKKKNAEVVHPESETVEIIPSTNSDLSAVQVTTEIPAPKETTTTNSVVTDSPQIDSNKVEVNQPSEVKSSNVAFDELAGLYPETKEQKKKKKVRRDH